MTIDERGYMSVEGMVLPIYRNDVYESVSVHETGDTFSLFPWAGDTDRIRGEATYTGRVLEIAEGVLAYITRYGFLGFYGGGEVELAEELLDGRGYSLISAFGQTREAGGSDTVEAAELLERLAEFWA